MSLPMTSVPPPELEEAPVPLVRRRGPTTAGFSLRPSRKEGEYIGEHLRVEGRLGKGGTADVFLARDIRDQTLLVVKRLLPELSENPELRRRFLLEAEALSHVSHPGVVRVNSIEPEAEPPWLTLEALPGETLGDFLAREGVMEPELALRLLRQAAHALDAVHDVGIVHRDIKPDNLFLVGGIGDPDYLKVLDFGMARLADEHHDEEDTNILGTVQYMPPEQILVEPVDGRTDVYALGVVLFRTLTGHLPFEGADKHALLRHQLFSPVPPPSWLNEDLPPGVEDVILRATQKNPSDRYASMNELGAALDRLVGLEPIERERASGINEIAPASYRPVSARGEKALSILAQDFGIYARSSLRPTPTGSRD